MGTSYRSKAFHDVSWKNLGDSGFPDRIAWMREAAKTRPEMDLERVGIYGNDNEVADLESFKKIVRQFKKEQQIAIPRSTQKIVVKDVSSSRSRP